MLTGFTTTIVGGRTQISQGNPDLKPERSTSFDAGAEWTSRDDADSTSPLFQTVVKDRFISNVVVSNPPPPDPIVLSVANGLDAHISGLDLEAEQRLGAHLGLFANATHYFNRKERLATGARAGHPERRRSNTVRAGVDVDFGRSARALSGRYVQGRKDNDFNPPGSRSSTTTTSRSSTPAPPIAWSRQHSVVRRDQQPVRRVLLREARLSAAGRVVQGLVSVGLLGR